jgi:hypothetical protein
VTAKLLIAVMFVVKEKLQQSRSSLLGKWLNGLLDRVDHGIQ